MVDAHVKALVRQVVANLRASGMGDAEIVRMISEMIYGIYDDEGFAALVRFSEENDLYNDKKE